MVRYSSGLGLPSLTGGDAQQVREGVHQRLTRFWRSLLDFRERWSTEHQEEGENELMERKIRSPSF
ncbi:hypothetical protein PanWU01x14_088060 [Parasponia andersonii]|uniref:Uncharacterized protein n=1 Tax=Parasponia andersonii TaxID=3476 RepID=A0A2P5D7V6_PARAD|nr:hypothetical protein PanWU01x14_088060 [Parasponia andersonii]